LSLPEREEMGSSQRKQWREEAHQHTEEEGETGKKRLQPSHAKKLLGPMKKTGTWIRGATAAEKQKITPPDRQAANRGRAVDKIAKGLEVTFQKRNSM